MLRQESEGEVTQGETEGFDRSDRVLLGEPANKGPVPKAWVFLFAKIPLCRTRSEDSADRSGRKSLTNVLCQESEGEVTQGETEGFDRSDRVLLGEPGVKKGTFRVPF